MFTSRESVRLLNFGHEMRRFLVDVFFLNHIASMVQFFNYSEISKIIRQGEAEIMLVPTARKLHAIYVEIIKTVSNCLSESVHDIFNFGVLTLH